MVLYKTDDIEQLILTAEVDPAEGVPSSDGVQCRDLGLERVVVYPDEVASGVYRLRLQRVPFSGLDLAELLQCPAAEVP
ncbi:MAG: hypothetical protein IKY48_06695 [Bacteroidales bacterium]|nr:hypothetical protein [Bacteroidales bacterium]